MNAADERVRDAAEVLRAALKTAIRAYLDEITRTAQVGDADMACQHGLDALLEQVASLGVSTAVVLGAGPAGFGQFQAALANRLFLHLQAKARGVAPQLLPLANDVGDMPPQGRA